MAEQTDDPTENAWISSATVVNRDEPPFTLRFYEPGPSAGWWGYVFNGAGVQMAGAEAVSFWSVWHMLAAVIEETLPDKEAGA